MSLPLDLILKELKTLDNSVLPILSSFHYDRSLLKNASNTERNHLISRTLNLSRSRDIRKRWASVNILNILCDEYEIIHNEGTSILVQLLKILDEEIHSGHVLTSVVEALNNIIQQVRGKPTLTREILTPKLPSIISLYVEKAHLQPKLIIDSLTDIMKKHPTVFRPFGNKLETKLISIIRHKHINSFDEGVKESIFRCSATLPVIEKSDPELKWERNLWDCIKEVAGVLHIYKIFLNIGDEEQLHEQFQKLPQPIEGESRRILSDLDINLDDPKSIIQISNSVEILLGVIKGMLNSSTSFGVKIPLGMIVLLNEVICSIDTRFVKFNYDIRDEQVKSIVKLTILKNQHNSVRMLRHLADVYRGNVIPHFARIVGVLESLVPLKRKSIDFDEVVRNEEFYIDVIQSIASHLSMVSVICDVSPFIRIIDLSLLLLEPRASEDASAANKNGKADNKSKKKKNKKDNLPMSDLLSHVQLFDASVSSSTISSLRHFFSVLIPRVVLPPTQHYKLMKYLVVEAVRMKSLDLYNQVPIELRQLMVQTVLHGGFEKVSLLPIVSNVLTDDPILSVFNNPRFPPLPTKYQPSEAQIVHQEDSQSESEDDMDTITSNTEKRSLKYEASNEDDRNALQNFKKHKGGFAEEGPDVHRSPIETPSSHLPETNYRSETVVVEKVVTDQQDGRVASTQLAVPNHAKETAKSSQTIMVSEEKNYTIPTSSEVMPSALQAEAEDGDSSSSDFEMPALDMGDDSDQD